MFGSRGLGLWPYNLGCRFGVLGLGLDGLGLRASPRVQVPKQKSIWSQGIYTEENI